MNRNLIILVGLALGSALLVAALVKTRVAPSTEGMQAIMVAKTDLPAGAKVSPKDFAWQPWPEGALPQGAIDEAHSPFAVAEGADKNDPAAEIRLRRGVFAGEPILANTLVNPGDSGFLAAALTDGMRAVALPVEAETSVAGFVRPGDWVDVILTYEVRLRSSGAEDASQLVVSRNASETVLSNVRVLAVDQEVQDQGTDAKPGRTVTVEVTPEQAERLALAQRMGDLSLSLRGMGEVAPEHAATGFTTDLDVGRALRAASMASMGFGVDGTPRQPAEEPAPAPAPPAVIRIYHGGQESEVQVISR
jgi:pilus assembly protein CpaB